MIDDVINGPSQGKKEEEEQRRALLNILSDFSDDKALLADSQKALLNILEDAASEKERLEMLQKANLNILEDFNEERLKQNNVQSAVLNILADSEEEKKRLEMLQKANLNILEDFHEEREKQTNIQKALMNILEDIANLNYVEQLNAELAKEVAERKKAELEIRERSVLVEAANKELEAFSYSISHDLRAHLRHIDGFSQLLIKKSEGQLDEKNKRYVMAISESVKQLGTMIDELLVYTRIGRTELNIERLKTNNIINDIVQKMRFEAQYRNITWEIESLPDIAGDRSQIYLIFHNLIPNAVKFTQRNDKAIIKITCQQNNEYYVFCIEDNGVGFDMRFYDKLFGLFQRLHNNDEFEGTGIGLANVKRFITKHGGKVWAESALGKGAAFYFSLPVPKDDKKLHSFEILE